MSFFKRFLARPGLPGQLLVVLVVLAASLVPIIAASRLNTPDDDAYITYVYARSLAQGDGFRAYPTAAPTLGTTTPLLAFALALLSRLLPAAEMKDLAVGLSVATWIGTGWLWLWKGKTFGLNRIECVSIAVLVLVETTVWISFLGMESRLFCFILTVCVILYFERHMLLAGIVSGLLFLTRGEGVLILGALYAYHIAANGLSIRKVVIATRKFLPVIAGFFLVFGVWAIYALSTIGVILPSTLGAKHAQFNTNLNMGFIEPFILSTFKLLTHNWNNLGIVPLGPISIGGWLALAVIGMAHTFMQRRRLLVFLMWTGAFVIGYTVIGVPGYGWYPLPLMYVMVVCAGLAPGALYFLLRGLLRPRWHSVSVIAAGAAVALICAIIVPQNIPSTPIVYDGYADYKHMAEWLNTNTPVGTKAAFLEVGMLQWYSQREIVDLMGLISPQILPALHQGSYPLAFEKGNADYLIYSEPFYWALDSVLATPQFSANYTLVAQLPGMRCNGNCPLLIYQRGAPSPAAPPPKPSDMILDLDARTGANDLTAVEKTPEGDLRASAGPEPYLYWQNLKLCAADYLYVVVEEAASAQVPGRILRLYYTSDSTFSKPQSGKTPILGDPAMHTYTIDTSLLAGWSGTLTGLRLDPIMGITSTGDNIVTVRGLRLVRNDGPSKCGL